MLNDWEGYLEHKSEQSLGVYRANVGKGGYTIFADMVRRESGKNFQSLPWCVTFVFAVHPNRRCLGEPCAGIRTLWRRMKLRGLARGRDYLPKPGDLIFCKTGLFKRLGHCGIVTRVDRGTVTSIDGNTVDPSATFKPSEGGAVAYRIRNLNSKVIYGYAEIGGL